MTKIEFVVHVVGKLEAPVAETTVGGMPFTSKAKTEGEAVASLLDAIFRKADIQRGQRIKVSVEG